MSHEDWDLSTDAAPDRNYAEVLDTVHRAAILSRRDAKRRGNVVHLPRRGEVLVTGDLHGCRENYERIVKFADLGRNPERHLVLQEIVHGGPTDDQGGCRSFELLEDAARLKTEFPEQVHMLLANHDVAEMLNIQLTKGVDNLTQLFAEGLAHAYGPHAAEVKAAYCALFRALPLALKTYNGVWISHSTPHLDALSDFEYALLDRELTDEDFSYEGGLYSFLWGRNQDEMAARIFAEHVGSEILIVGHQPAQMGYKIPNSRHIILYSDNQLGRYLMVPLGKSVTHADLALSIKKISSLPR